MAEPTSAPVLRYVTASALNVRERPSASSPSRGPLRQGELVTVLGASNDGRWVYVNWGANRDGWVAPKYLSEGAVAPAEPPWLTIARGELGEHELPGAPANPRIVEYLSSCQLDHQAAQSDETLWCSGFVNWCVEQAGLAGTNSALATSWRSWGHRIPEPRLGAVTILTRQAGNHVGFWMRKVGASVELLGGNQGNAVSLRPYDPSRVLEYRWAQL